MDQPWGAGKHARSKTYELAEHPWSKHENGNDNSEYLGHERQCHLLHLGHGLKQTDSDADYKGYYENGKRELKRDYKSTASKFKHDSFIHDAFQ
jgi:hypothetical protein